MAIRECSKKCFKKDCNYLGLFIVDLDEEESKNYSAIKIEIDNLDFRAEANPLFPLKKLAWIFFAFFSLFFGINFYGLLLKLTNFSSVTKILQSYRTRNRRKLRKNRKNFVVLILIVAFVLIISIVIELYTFKFGKEVDKVFFKKDLIEERPISVSVCFDLCEILKENSSIKNCSEEFLIKNMTISQLDAITKGEKEFKKIASMRSSARVYPIRDDDFYIPVFFRNAKKCFLLFYGGKILNLWSHLPKLRKSFLYITIEKFKFTYFFIEDGTYTFPKFDSIQTTKSVIHRINIDNSKGNCTNYREKYFGDSRNDCIQKCVINKTINGFPINNTNFVIGNDLANYSSLKFINNSNDETLEKCIKKYEKKECDSITTLLTYKKLFKAIGMQNETISINLTPYSYEFKDIDDENKLIVLNRIFSYLIILTRISLKEFLNILLSIYFHSIVKHFNFHLFKRIAYLILFLIFLIHFAFLFYRIINHPLLESAFSRSLDKIVLSKSEFML